MNESFPKHSAEVYYMSYLMKKMYLELSLVNTFKSNKAIFLSSGEDHDLVSHST